MSFYLNYKTVHVHQTKTATSYVKYVLDEIHVSAIGHFVHKIENISVKYSCNEHVLPYITKKHNF